MGNHDATRLGEAITVRVLTATVLAVTLAGCAGGTHPHSEPEKLAPCKFEDGPGPCVWDAQHRGNGVGDSFWIDEAGDVHYF